MPRALTAAGGRIFEHSEAEEFRDAPLAVKANGHWVSCEDIVIATHNPLVGIASMASATVFQTKLSLYTSYVVAGRVPRGTVPDALFWDTADPYRYMRLESHRDHDLLIAGGEDHKTGQAESTSACFDRLEQAVTARVPDITLTHRWSGQVIETPDGLPVHRQDDRPSVRRDRIRRQRHDVRDPGGDVIADAIQGRDEPVDRARSSRAGPRCGAGCGSTSRRTPTTRTTCSAIGSAAPRAGRSATVKRGQGRVIEHHGEKVAAFRDSQGALTLRSAVCTHMGCVVGWNDAEGTWDCPCHGSRFTPQGDVISGRPKRRCQR